MTEEFNLSDYLFCLEDWEPDFVEARYVREFIKRLKEEIGLRPNRDDGVVPIGKHGLKKGILDGGGIGKQEVDEIIDKLAGDKLK